MWGKGVRCMCLCHAVLPSSNTLLFSSSSVGPEMNLKISSDLASGQVIPQIICYIYRTLAQRLLLLRLSLVAIEEGP